MEYKVTVNCRSYRVTPEQVAEAMQGVKPDRIQTHAVKVGGNWYPPKQVLALVLGVERTDFGTPIARRLFGRMGLPLRGKGDSLIDERADGRPALRPGPEFLDILPAETEYVTIGPLLLEWSWWEWWDDLLADGRAGGGVAVPREPGVYEAKVYGGEERLHIGRASNLWARVKHALVRGAAPHPAGAKIRENEDTSRVCVRWAFTDRPAAVEEELHRRHIERFGRLPKYTQQT